MVKLAIIGTAGRRDDAGVLDKDVYTRMIEGTKKFIDHFGIGNNLELVSGGAAWADHLVVELCKEGLVSFKNLTLYFPCRLEYYGFEGEDEKSQKTANTINYYHKLFSDKVGLNSIADLNLAVKSSATTEVYAGFHARNYRVAKSLLPGDHVLAFTTGNPKSTQPSWTIRSFDDLRVSGKTAGLKDGGTEHTFGLCHCLKHHARIGPIDKAQLTI